MRLIDADELEKVMTEDWFLEILATQDGKSAIKKDIVNAIDSLPKAFDVDKVVEEIKSLSGYEIYKNTFDLIIEIVRKGGVKNE